MKVGTTGSRNPRPDRVCQRFKRLLIEWGATELHHGDCIGWDQQAHRVAVDLGLKTVAHPPNVETLRAFCEADEIRPALPYLERNERIITSTDKIIAAPDGPEKLRSGTWSTVRKAKSLGVKGVIIGVK